MLGAHTKQINAYGKRGRRVIDITGDNATTGTSKEIISIFDDLPPPPEWKSVASKMKKRENVVPTKSSIMSVKAVGLQRKKRLSPILSPPKKKRVARVVQLTDSEVVRKSNALVMKPKAKPPLASGNVVDPIVISASPVRAPLTSVTLNIPGSPSVSRTPNFLAKKHQNKTKKPFSPFVDVDIVILDEEGQTLRTEKRVSRTDIQANPFGQRIGSLFQPAKKELLQADIDSECEIINPPRRLQRPIARKQIILSDDSDSESEQIISTKPTHVRPKPKSQVEVLIPLAPYKGSNRNAKSITTMPKSIIPVSSESPSSVTESYDPLSSLSNPHIETTTTRYQPNASPIHKPRQLTPIRGGGRRLFNPPSPPSPTTPTDLDLSLDFSELNFGLDYPAQGACQNDFDIPDSLILLLEECHQEKCGPHNFSAFIESFPYDPVLDSSRESSGVDMEFKKIGEASYSEVFGIGNVVLKVIPLRDESITAKEMEGDGPAPSDAKDVRKEIIVTRAMGEVHSGFVKLLKTYVVRGRYPEVLLRLWDDYNERKGSESMRPDTFRVSQVYAIIVLPNGGPDLEAYSFRNTSRMGWRQACSLFWQVAKALAHAERLVSFEHRDLHWGQILVKNVSTKVLKSLNLNQKVKSKPERIYMDDLAHGVQATVIDLGLSRMDAGDGSDGDEVHWTQFDDEVFMGEGDYQFDVYRLMKEFTGGRWEAFHPVTNVIWLHYLLQKIIHSKGIKPPSIPRKPKVTSESRLPPISDAAFSEKECHDCLVDIEEWLRGAIGEVSPAANKAACKGKGRRQIQPSVKPNACSGPASAGEIVAYAEKKGWIKATTLT